MKNGQRTEAYAERYFIAVDEFLLEVSQEQYKQYYRDKRRQKYLQEEAVLHREVSYDALHMDELDLDGAMINKNNFPLDEFVIHKTLLKHLVEIMALLTEEEMSLVKALYYDKLPEREYAQHIGLSQKGVNKRKHKILQKIKKFIKI